MKKIQSSSQTNKKPFGALHRPGECIPVLGEAKVSVQYKGQQELLYLVVITGNGPYLLGRNWIAEFQQDWTQVAFMSAISKYQ